MKPGWKVLLAVLAVIGSMLPSGLAYLAARQGSNEAKIRTEIGYEALKKSVQELQDTSYAHAIALAKLQGQMDAQVHYQTSERRAPASKLAAPPSLSKAVESYNAK
jgi:hypothetical protein